MSSRPPIGGERPSRSPSNGLQLITWGDVFVLIEHGTAPPSEYLALGRRITAIADEYPRGIGGLTIIVKDAAPPSKEVRDAIGDTLDRLGPALRCHCWLVEGDGFHAAMIRGVLTGLRILSRFPFESHIATALPAALTWILGHLDDGELRLRHLDEGVQWIAEKRRELDE